MQFRSMTDHSVRRYGVLWYRTLVVLCCLGFVMVIGAQLVSSWANPGAFVFITACFLCALALLLRASRFATIELSATDITIRELVHTKRIPLSQIRDVRVGVGSSILRWKWRVPVFDLRDGSAIRADDIRSLRHDSVVDEVVAEARRRIA